MDWVPRRFTIEVTWEDIQGGKFPFDTPMSRAMTRFNGRPSWATCFQVSLGMDGVATMDATGKALEWAFHHHEPVWPCQVEIVENEPPGWENVSEETQRRWYARTEIDRERRNERQE